MKKIRLLFLDFDGVLNSKQEVIWKRRSITKLYKLKMRVADKVCHAIWKLLPNKHKKTFMNYAMLWAGNCTFDPIACSNVQWLLDQFPDLYIVISSTWRINAGYPFCKTILKHNGIDASRVIGCTPRYGSLKGEHGMRMGAQQRGHQVQAYLNSRNDIKCFAIIDDDSDMVHLDPYYVKIDGHTGFTIRDAYRVYTLLGGKASEIPKETLFDF